MSREQLLSEVLDALPERVSRYRVTDRVVVYCNHAWAAGHRRSPDECIGVSLDDLLTPAELEGLDLQLGRLDAQQPLLTDLEPRPAPEDPELFIEWLDLLLDGADGPEVLSVGRDVTEQHHARRAIRESEERFRLAMSAAPIGMELLAPDGTILEVNDQFCAFLGRSREELKRMNWRELTYPEDLPRDERMLARLKAGDIASYTVEKRYLHADGSVRWGLHSGAFARSADGEPLYGIGQIVDITGRRERQRQSARREALVRLAGSVARLGGWTWDVVDDVVEWSDVVHDILGHGTDEPLHIDDVVALYPQDERERVLAAVERCLTEGVPWDLEHGMHTRSGERVWIRSVGEPGFDDDGRVVRISGALQDLTERHLAAQESLAVAEELAATLKNMHDGFLTVDDDYRITYVNPHAAEFAGRSAEEIVGRDLFTELPDLVASPVSDAARAALTRRKASRIERYHDAARGLWLELEVYPAPRGGIAIHLRDITHQVERSDALERTLDVERAATDRLRELDRVKNAFLSAVSHELRTPSTVVYGMASSLQRLRGDLDEAARRRIEDAIVVHAARLQGLLDDLLDTDRLARGEISAVRIPFDVAALVREVVETSSVAPRATVEAPDELVVEADRVQVERIASNLLENAAKYAPAGPVRVRLGRLGSAGFRLEVTDDGPGIDAAELDRIFERFHRVDDDHPQPGTGIGLALVADFARLHGGRAWAVDTGRSGAHLVVDIPDGATSDDVHDGRGAPVGVPRREPRD